LSGIGKQALFYRGYLTDDRSLMPVTILLATAVTLSLAVYLGDIAVVPSGIPTPHRTPTCMMQPCGGRDGRGASAVPDGEARNVMRSSAAGGLSMKDRR